MKKSNRLLYAVMLLLLPVICSCKKEETTSADCKTCRALGSLGTIEKRVCSPDEEQAFRNEHAGREISCR